MKKLLILTAVAMLTAVAQGCCHKNNIVNRGAPCNTCPTSTAPAPCASGAPFAGDAYMTPPAGGMYAPGPG